ncbi:MAG: hypothetical protein N2449_00700 [Bacteroidales bacterium]|nr:hypothetical protein [Bacteroidales bacterium]
MNQKYTHKRQPFTVPDGYFQQLPNNILQQINEIPPSQSSKSLFIIAKKQLALAAAFISFVFISYGVFHFIYNSVKPKQNITQQTFDDIVLANVDESDIVYLLTTDIKPEEIKPETLENILLDETLNDDIIYNDNLNQ